MLRFLWGLFFSFALLLFCLLGWFVLDFFYIPITENHQSLVIMVEPGQSMAAVVNDLGEKDILKHPNFFLMMAKLQGHISRVKTGEYVINGSMTPATLLNSLVKGKILLHKITLVEGWTFVQVLHALQNNPYLAHTLNELSDAEIMSRIGHPGEASEGRFYPDTFLFAANTKDSKILQMSYDLMQKKLLKAWDKRAPNLPYTDPFQALIVASMIEKETAKINERPLVAGVILKRLQMGMRLQIDASVIYGSPERNGSKISRSMLNTDTPYNTYTRNGLPPTPIAMPSLSAIEAALHPQITGAIYYVAKGDGSHTFSNTLKSHHQAVEQYRTQNKSPAPLGKYSTSVELMLDFWPTLSGQDIFAVCPFLTVTANSEVLSL